MPTVIGNDDEGNVAGISDAQRLMVAHKDYSSGNPIQIKVYENRITFWNAGQLPETWTVADLLKEHPSIPYNPDIATAFFRAGLIEAWGRGTLKIIRECENAGLPEPVFSYNQAGFRIEFKKAAEKTSEKILLPALNLSGISCCLLNISPIHGILAVETGICYEHSRNKERTP